jgi:hypothetical protein
MASPKWKDYFSHLIVLVRAAQLDASESIDAEMYERLLAFLVDEIAGREWCRAFDDDFIDFCRVNQE